MQDMLQERMGWVVVVPGKTAPIIDLQGQAEERKKSLLSEEVMMKQGIPWVSFSGCNGLDPHCFWIENADLK